MSMNQDRLKYLLEQYAEKTGTDEEALEMFAMIKAANEEDDESIKMWLNEKLAATEPDTNYDYKRWNKVLVNIISPIRPQVPAAHGADANAEAMPGKVRRLHVWKRVAAAACIFLAIGTGWYFITHKTNNPILTEVAHVNDVQPPTTNRATIRLASGQIVYLDSVNNGTLAQQGNVNLQKLADGKIVYNSESSIVNSELVYNTLTNPRGSKVIDMTLSDGSRVWLNAGSSVTYPIAFTGKERKVSMNGEVYFEVAPLTPKGGHEKMPFIVEKGNMSVTVLGTHFNVNAYDDESDIKVTLLEGSVKASMAPLSPNGEQEKAAFVILKPGEQAQVSNGIKVVKGIDVDAVMAWKNGRFVYNNADLETIMRQMARWYDVDVVYKDKITDRYTVTTQSNMPVSQLFKFIEMSGGVHFIIDGRKITVAR